MTPSTSFIALAEHSNLLFYSFHLTEGRFVYLNRAFREFVDLSDSTPEYSRLFEMVHEEDREYVESTILKCLQGEAVSDLEFRVNRSGNSRWLPLSSFLYQENGNKLLMGHAEDITTFKEQTHVLNEHNSKKNSILNILAHDLAGPIGNIANLSALIERETASLHNAKISDYLEIMKKITDNALRLIHDFLNQEFLETQGVKLVKRRVELVSKISRVMEEYKGMQKDLRLQFSCTANRELIYAEIDEDKFLQVINNLISNSMKFTPDGGTISIRIEEQKEGVRIIVADTGVGIPKKYHAILFDKFSEARRSGLKGQLSTGLGMSIIKTIMDWHGGKIWVESEENKGTTVYLEIPK